MTNVRVRYVASLREDAGCEIEEIATDCSSAASLYEALRARHGFRFELRHLRVAVNNRFESMDAALKAGDEVLFLPPVAGG
ncbi:MAG TPA: MoaD/ThiS family protein [Kiritimatiellia bacterium]|jgi:molybdopterin converting factor subunit 1